MTQVDEIVAKLSAAQRVALTRQLPKVARAGDLFPGRGQEEAAGWLRETPLIERYMHTGHFAYRLTPLGLAVRAHLQAKEE